jgi:hypothetical protein
LTYASFAILPLFGWLCGKRGFGFGRYLKNLVLTVFLQRLAIVVVAFFATTRSLGTHLDTHSVTDIRLPGIGSRTLTTPMDAWIWTMLVSQLTYAVVFSAVMGLVLGIVPWAIAKRRAAPA